MARKAFFAALALLLSGCGGEPGLDARAACVPDGGQSVVHAWKGGLRYCFRYAADSPGERAGSRVVIARTRTN